MEPLWIEFVNSEACDPLGRDRVEDRLARPGWLRALLARRKLPPLEPDRPDALQALRALRALLQHCTARLVTGQDLRPTDLRALNRHLRAQPVVTELRHEKDGLRLDLVPVSRDLDAVLGAIARSFARFVCEEDPSRLKTCDNPDCGWVFYDATRSRTRRWCADSCGNLMKVRRFRARRRHGCDGDAPTGTDPAG